MPEDWRIVYKNSYSRVIVGVISFLSDREARSSVWWDEFAFKTIRVDA